MTETRERNYQGVFDTAIGFGRKPCVLVIDFIRAYTTKGAAFFGQGVVDAVDATVGLLAAARKARNHRLIQQGLLFDLVGLASRDPAELAGALAALAELDDPVRWAQWKTKGQAVLARKAEMNGKG